MFRILMAALLVLTACGTSHILPVKTTDSIGKSPGQGKPTNSGKDYGVANGFPSEWWKDVADIESWEIAPSTAQAGEVILSKRTALGILSNFANTPFTYRGKLYASVEGFWQATKFPESQNDERLKNPSIQWKWTREEVEKMSAFEAKAAGKHASENLKTLGIDWVTFEGMKMTYREPGESAFFKLIRAAMIAKLVQNPEVREILLKTRDLILLPDHKQGPDDQLAWKYHEIWMDLRDLAEDGGI